MVMQKKKGSGEPRKHLGHGICDSFSRSTTFGHVVSDLKEIEQEAIHIYKKLNIPPKELRGIGVHISDLVSESHTTTSTSKKNEPTNKQHTIDKYFSTTKGNANISVVEKDNDDDESTKHGDSQNKNDVEDLESSVIEVESPDISNLDNIRKITTTTKQNNHQSDTTNTKERKKQTIPKDALKLMMSPIKTIKKKTTKKHDNNVIIISKSKSGETARNTNPETLNNYKASDRFHQMRDSFTKWLSTTEPHHQHHDTIIQVLEQWIIELNLEDVTKLIDVIKKDSKWKESYVDIKKVIDDQLKEIYGYTIT
eukprot:TRINITY_DN5330_c0_g1_i1.p1 TRINITY_DN5330_c0_g1~~TRINITY_DN5330_c0_g1_i1.p1  ORF type:complete len:310 (-),score=84.05 TRINITY_DN5330_c0_g1_i1:198-1127(-)